MSLLDYRPFRWLGVPYTPNAEDRPFLERAEVRRDDDLTVTASGFLLNGALFGLWAVIAMLHR
jgi:hypothetical protein